MDELRAYVDALFARRGDTPENRDLKEEIYGNLAARRDDLIAQGVPEPEAVRAAKAQLPSLEGVLGTGVRVNAQQWRAARVQSLLLASVIFWVLTIPLLLVRTGAACLVAFAAVAVFGVLYLCRRRGDPAAIMTVDTVQRDLVYDSAAAFALIDNLSAVTYAFSDGSYAFTRAQMEALLGAPLSALRDGTAMHDRVQARLDDADFVASFYAQAQPEG